MTTVDPLTNTPLPPTAIQRLLYIHPSVHVYAVPPLQSSRGHSASTWTTRPEIFRARLRVLETAIPAADDESAPAHVSVALLLEDPKSGELFAAAPYTSTAAVEQAVDSSRFFAVRVVGEGGRKATLGVGFEERGDAFDFGVAVQEAGKVLGFGGRETATKKSEEAGKRDFSLKEGETITVNIGSRGRRLRTTRDVDDGDAGGIGFVGSGEDGIPMLSAPPSASEVKKRMEEERRESVKEQGFDDDFGDFQ